MQEKSNSDLKKAFEAISLNGPLVGVIHRVYPKSDQQDSLLFFENGSVMTLLNLRCGEKTLQSIALKIVLQQIFGIGSLVEGEVVSMFGTEAAAVKALGANQTACYIFRPPTSSLLDLDDVEGTKVIYRAVQEICGEDDYFVDVRDLVE